MKKTTKPQQEEKLENKFEREIESLREQTSSLDDKFKRALADYQNLERNQHQSRLVEKGKIITKFLPLLDSLELTSQHVKDPVTEMIVKEFKKVLNELGVDLIESDRGVPFNSLSMECLEVVPGEKNKVIKTLQTGYRLGETILRPAKVEVGNSVSDRDPAMAGSK